MTDHKPGDVVGLFGNKVQIEVTSDHPNQQNSYRTVSGTGDDADTATVTVEAGFTFFRYNGDVFMFDGVTYFPNSDYRNDDGYTDGDVSLVHPDGIRPDMGHRFNPEVGTYTLGDFVDDLVNGRLEPTTNPDSTHD